jgi:histidinol-phosphate aminotransferase
MTDQSPTGPVAQPGIMDIAPYIPGKSTATYNGKIHKLSSNESPLGASPQAIKAYGNLAGELEYYPDGSASDLRHAIGNRFGLNREQIICGSGSDEILQLISSAFLGQGDEAIYTRHGFLVYPIAIKANGATPVIADEVDFTANVDEIIAKLSDKTKVIFLANPNNPTGTYLPFDEIKRLHAALPESCLLVLDAAYAEYVKRNDYEAGIELAGSASNVIMTRTFSKIFGLAGLRLGWGYASAGIIDTLNRIRGPFNVNAAAIAAGTAAMNDVSHIEKAVAHNEQWRPWLTEKIDALGIKVTPSVGNFLLLHFASGKAAKADQFLGSNGLILRAMGAYGLPDALRLTIGSQEANEKLVSVLAEFMKADANG